MTTDATVQETGQPDAADTTTTNVTDWRSSLPEDIRDHSALADYKDVGGLAKSLIHAQSRLGAAVVIPGEDASPEDMASFYTRLGRPESADGYELAIPEGSPISKDDPWIADFREMAFKHGLSKSQASALMADMAEQTSAAYAEAETQYTKNLEEASASLKSEWGTHYEERSSLAKQVLEKYGGKELLDLFASAGLADHPQALKFAHNVAQTLREDNVPGRGQAFTAAMAPVDAQREITKLQADKEFMSNYTSPYGPGRKAAHEKMQSLYSLAYPTEGGA